MFAIYKIGSNLHTWRCFEAIIAAKLIETIFDSKGVVEALRDFYKLYVNFNTTAFIWLDCIVLYHYHFLPNSHAWFEFQLKLKAKTYLFSYFALTYLAVFNDNKMYTFISVTSSYLLNANSITVLFHCVPFYGKQGEGEIISMRAIRRKSRIERLGNS